MWSAVKRSKRIRVSGHFSAAFVVGIMSMQASYAGPHGGEVIRGEGNIVRPDATTTNINQNSRLIVINWDSFNVATNETVNFYQPSSDAAALNRIFDQNPSQIFGTINANGRVLLVNPNGLLFGQSASVNVGSLIASGLDVDPDAFMAENWTFENANGATGGVVVNRGLLQAAQGGSVSLFGGGVVNTGTVLANYGSINLAAGEQVTIDFDGDGLIQFAVDGEVLENAHGLASAVSNEGTLQAASGQILMSAASANDVFAQVVNNSGVIEASGVNSDGGRVFLTGSGGDVVNTGSISATSEHGDGGEVRLLGDRVGLFDDALVDVSGRTGGGTALIGGDYRGGGGIQNSAHTVVGSDVVIRADALESGDGGTVIVWADGLTQFFGAISARGGNVSGDGGFGEVSGLEQLVYRGDVDMRAPNGTTGTLLLDPRDIVIQGGSGPSDNFGDDQVRFAESVGSDVTVFEDDLESAGANIVLEAENSITTAGTFDNIANGEAVGVLLLPTGFDITMRTRNNVGDVNGSVITPGIDLSAITVQTRGNGSITLETGSDGAGGGGTDAGVEAGITVGSLITADRTDGSTGSIVIDAEGDVSVTGALTTGTVSAGSGDRTSGSISITSGGTIDTTVAGTLTTGDVTVSGNNDSATGGGITLNAAGDINLAGSVSTGAVSSSGDAATGGDISLTSTGGTVVTSAALSTGTADGVDTGATSSGDVVIAGANGISVGDAVITGAVTVTDDAGNSGDIILTSSAGTITTSGMLATGDVNADDEASTSGQVDIDASTGITLGAAINTGAVALDANNVSATTGGINLSTDTGNISGISLSSGDATTTAGGGAAESGAIDVEATAGAVTFTGAVTSGLATAAQSSATSGLIDITAGNGDIQLWDTASGAATSSGGDFAAASGSLTLAATTGAVTLSGAVASGDADSADLNATSGTVNITAGAGDISGAGTVTTGNADGDGNGVGEFATSGTLTLNASGAIQFSADDALRIGNASLDADAGGNDNVNIGNISLVADSVSSDGASGRLDVSIGTGTVAGDAVINAGAISADTSAGTGGVFISSSEDLRVADLDTGAGAQTVDIATTGAANLDVLDMAETLAGDAISFGTVTGTLTLNDTALAVGAGSLTLTGDEIDLAGGAGSVAGTGSVTLRTSTLVNDVRVGDAVDSGAALDLTDTDLAALADGFADITIGRNDATGTLFIDSGSVTFADAITLEMTSGNVTLEGDLLTTGNAITINATAIDLGTGAIAIDATSGAPAGADIAINGVVGDAGNDASLVVDAGTGGTLDLDSVTTGLGQSYSANNIDINGTMYQSTTSGAIAFNGSVDLDNGGTITVQTAGVLASDDITFSSTIDGASALELQAGAGDIDIANGPVGGATALSSLTVTSANSLAVGSATADGAIDLTATTIDGSGGDIVLNADTVAVNGAVTTAGNNVDITAASGVTTTGSIATAAAADSGLDSGNVRIDVTGTGNINVADIDTSGANSTTNGVDGSAGGDVVITSNNGTVAVANIDTSGGDHNEATDTPNNGGAAGAIDITSGGANDLTLNGQLVARGGTTSDVSGAAGTDATTTIVSGANVVDGNTLGPDIDAGTLDVTAGDVLSLETQVDSVTGNTGAIEIANTGALTVAGIAAAGSVTLSADSIAVAENGVLAGANDVSLTATNGDITDATPGTDTNANIVTSGQVSLTAIDAGAGSASIGTGADPADLDLSGTTDLVLNAANDVFISIDNHLSNFSLTYDPTAGNTFSIGGGFTTITLAENSGNTDLAVVDNGGDNLNFTLVTTAGDLLIADGAIRNIGTGDVALTANAGSILDADTGADTAANITTGGNLNLTALGTIGSGAGLAALDVVAGANTSLVSGGNINLEADSGTLTVSGIDTSAGSDTVNLVAASGSGAAITLTGSDGYTDIAGDVLDIDGDSGAITFDTNPLTIGALDIDTSGNVVINTTVATAAGSAGNSGGINIVSTGGGLSGTGGSLATGDANNSGAGDAGAVTSGSIMIDVAGTITDGVSFATGSASDNAGTDDAVTAGSISLTAASIGADGSEVGVGIGEATGGVTGTAGVLNVSTNTGGAFVTNDAALNALLIGNLNAGATGSTFNFESERGVIFGTVINDADIDLVVDTTTAAGTVSFDSDVTVGSISVNAVSAGIVVDAAVATADGGVGASGDLSLNAGGAIQGVGSVATGDAGTTAGSITLDGASIGTGGDALDVVLGAGTGGALNLASGGGDVFVTSASALTVGNLAGAGTETFSIATTGGNALTIGAGTNTNVDGITLDIDTTGAGGTVTFDRALTVGAIDVDAADQVAVNAALATADNNTGSTRSIGINSGAGIGGTGSLTTGDATGGVGDSGAITLSAVGTIDNPLTLATGSSSTGSGGDISLDAAAIGSGSSNPVIVSFGTAFTAGELAVSTTGGNAAVASTSDLVVGNLAATAGGIFDIRAVGGSSITYANGATDTGIGDIDLTTVTIGGGTVAFDRDMSIGRLRVTASGDVTINGNIVGNSTLDNIILGTNGSGLSGTGSLTSADQSAAGGTGSASVTSGNIIVDVEGGIEGVTFSTGDATLTGAPILGDTATAGSISLEASYIGAAADRVDVALGVASAGAGIADHGELNLATLGAGGSGDAYITSSSDLELGTVTTGGAGDDIDVLVTGGVLTLTSNYTDASLNGDNFVFNAQNGTFDGCGAFNCGLGDSANIDLGAAGSLTVIADNLVSGSFADVVAAGGGITLSPYSTGRLIGLGSVTTGEFDLSNADINALLDAADATNNGTLTVGTAGAGGSGAVTIDDIVIDLGETLVINTNDTINDDDDVGNAFSGGTLMLSATNGIGTATTLNIDADVLSATVTGAGAVDVTDSDGLQLGGAGGGIATTNGGITIVTNGLTTSGNTITAGGASALQITNNGADSDLGFSHAVSSAGGDITLHVADGTLSTSGVSTTGAGTISLTANDVSGGAAVVVGGSGVNTGSGAITIAAADAVIINSAVTTTGNVFVTADDNTRETGDVIGSISGGGQISGGAVSLSAAQGITANTAATTLTVDNTVSGSVLITEADDVAFATHVRNQSAGGLLSVATIDGSIDTSTATVSTIDGSITLTAGDAGANNGGITIGSGGIDSGSVNAGDVSLNAADGVTLTGSVDASGTTTSGDIAIEADDDADGTGAIAGAGTLAAQAVTLNAATGISANTAAMTLAVDNTTSGNISITEADDVAFAGQVRNQSAGSSLSVATVDGSIDTAAATVSTIDGSITLTAGDAGANNGGITIGSGGIDSGSVNAGDVFLNAADGVTLTGSVDASGTTASGDIIIEADDDADNAGAIAGAGTLTAQAVTLNAATGINANTAATTLTADNTTSGNVSIIEADDLTFATHVRNQAANGSLSVTTTDGSIDTSTASVSVNTGNILLFANDATNSGADITVGSGDVVSGGGTISIYAADSIVLDGDVTGTGIVNVTADDDANNRDTTPDDLGSISGAGTITGSDIWLRASAGISANTAADSLSAYNRVSGNVNITEADDVTFMSNVRNLALTGSLSVTTTDGAIDTSTSTLRTNNGDLSLTAGDTGGNNGNVTIGSGGAYSGNNNAGDINISAAGNVWLEGDVSASGATTTGDVIINASSGEIGDPLTAPGTVTGSHVNLTAATGMRVSTEAATLTADNTTSGDLRITEADDVTLVTQFRNLAAGRQLTLVSSDGDIDTSTAVVSSNDGFIGLSAQDSSNTGATLTIGTGGIDSGTTNAGNVTLLGADGIVLGGNVDASGSTTSGDVAMDANSWDGTIDAVGAITRTAGTVSGNMMNLVAASGITMNAAVTTLTVDNTDSGNVAITEADDVTFVGQVRNQSAGSALSVVTVDGSIDTAAATVSTIDGSITLTAGDAGANNGGITVGSGGIDSGSVNAGDVFLNAADGVTLTGSVDASGTTTSGDIAIEADDDADNAGAIAGAGTLSAQAVTLNAATGVGATGAGRINVSATGIDSTNTTSGGIFIDASGADVTFGTIDAQTAGDVELFSNGDIQLGAVSGTGNVHIESTAGSIFDAQDDESLTADVAGSDVTLIATGDIGGADPVMPGVDPDDELEVNAASSLSLDAQSVFIDDVGGNDVTLDFAGTNFSYSSSADILVGAITATGTVSLFTDGGSINDATADTVTDITGTTVTLTARDEIGGDGAAVGGGDTRGALEIASDALDVSVTTAGDIVLHDTGGTELVDVDTLSGAIDIDSDSALVVTDVRTLGGTAADDITLSATSLDLGTVNAGAGGSLVATANAIDVTGIVTAAGATLDADGGAGNITDTGGHLVVSGTTALLAQTTDTVVLDGADNDFNVITISDAASAMLRDTDNIALGATSVAGTLQVTAGGAIEAAAAADGAADINAASIDFNAGNGIGTLGALEINAAGVDADSTTGDINLDSIATLAVVVNSLTTGTGNITFDQVGGQTLNISNASATDGAIGISNDGANLTLGTISAGGGNNVTATTTTGGSIALDSISAAGAQVSLTAFDAIGEMGAGDGTIDITADSIDLGAGTGIGAANALEISGTSIAADSVGGAIRLANSATGATTVTSLTTDSANVSFTQTGGQVLNIDSADVTTSGDLAITNNAGINVDDVSAVGTVSLTATGAIEERNTDAGADVTGAAINLDATAGIGAAGTLETDSAFVTAETDNNDIDLENVFAGSVTVNNLQTGTGDIRFNQAGAGSLVITSAVTSTDGGIDIDNAGGELTLVSVTANGAGDIAADTTGSGDIRVGTLAAAGDAVILNSAGEIRDNDVDALTDITAASISLDAVTGIGATEVLELAGATAISAETTDGDIDMDHVAGAAAVTVSSLATGAGNITFEQTGGRALVIDSAVITTAGSIVLNNDADLALTDIDASVNAGDSISATTTAGGDIIVSSVIAGGTVSLDSSGAINEDGGNDAAIDIIGTTVDLTAESGIGDDVIPEVRADNLAVQNNTAGNIRLGIDGDVALTGAGITNLAVNGGLDITAVNGSIDTGAGPLTTNGGLIRLATTDTDEDGGDATPETITVGTGGIFTGGGDIILDAADDVILTGETDAGAGNVTITANAAGGDAVADGTGSITGSGLVTGATVGLHAAEAIGTSGTRVETAAGTLNMDAGTDIFVNEADGVTLGTVTAGGNMTFDATGTGDILVGSIDVAGTLDLEAQDGSIQDDLDDIATDITAGVATLTASGDIGGNVLDGADVDPREALEVDAGTLNLNASNVTISDAGGATATLSFTGGAFNYLTDNDILVDSIVATGDVTLISNNGSINDDDPNEDMTTDIDAANVSLTAFGEIGGTAHLDIASDSLSANVNDAGNIVINDTGGTTLADLATANGNITVNSDSSLELGSIDATGTVSITSDGAITDANGDSDVRGMTVALAATTGIGTAAEAITTNTANLDLDTDTGNVVISETDGVNISGVSADDFTLVTGGAITDSGAILVSGTTTLNAGGNNIVLNDGSNDFGTVVVAAANNVVLTDINGVTLGASNIAGTLGVTANGDIVDSGVLDIGGGATFAAGAANDITLDNLNDFTSVAITSGDNVTLRDVNTLTLGSATVSNLYDVTANGITLNGTISAATVDFDATGAAGAINQIGGSLTATTATVAAQTNDAITLAQSDNNFGTVVITQGGNVTLADEDAVVLGASDVSGDLDVTATGTITDSGNLVVDGLASFAAGAVNDITLDNANNFAELSIVSADDVTINDAGGLALNDSVVSGNLDITTTGDITNTGDVAVAGTATFAAGNTSDILLDRLGNDFASVVVTTANDVTLGDTDGIRLASVSATGGVDVTANSIEVDTVSTPGNVSLTASNGVIDDTDGNSMITAGDLAFIATGAVGGTNALNTTVATISSGQSTGMGAININEIDALTVASMSNGNGQIGITAGSTLTTGTLTTNNGGIALNANGINVNGAIDAGGSFAATSTGNLALNGVLNAASVQLDATGSLAINNTIDSSGSVSVDSGGTTSIAANGDISAGGVVSFGAARSGAVQTAGDITTSGDSVSFNRAFTLTGNVAIDTTNSGASATGAAVSFAGTVGGGGVLDINAGSAGDVSFAQSVGGTPLAGLVIDADRVTFSGNLTTAAGGNVTIDNAGLLSFANSSVVSLGGAFNQSGTGTVSLGADITTTSDAITFNGAVTLTDAVALDTTGAATVRFANTVAGGGANLTVDAGGNAGSVRFEGDVNNVATLSVTGGSTADLRTGADVNAGTVNFTGDAVLANNSRLAATSGQLAVDGDLALGNGASVTTNNGTIDIGGGVQLTGNTNATLQSGGGGAINIAGDVTTAGGAQALTVRSSADMNLADVDITGDVVLQVDREGDVNFHTLTANNVAGANVSLQGGADNNDRFDVGTVTSSGDVTIASAVTLTGDMNITSGGDVMFSDAVRSTNGTSLSVHNAGTLTVGAALDLGGAFTQTGGAVNLDGDITTSGDAVSLAGTVNIGGATRGIETGTGAITLGPVNGSGTLDLDSSGTFTVSGDINVGGLDVSGMSGRLDVDGEVEITTANTDLDLESFASIQAAAGGGALTLDAGTGQVLLATVGNTTALDAFNVAGDRVRAGNVTTIGDQSYSGTLVQLSGTQVASAGDIAVDGALNLLANNTMSGDSITLNGAIDGGFRLYIDANGSAALNGDVGATTALAGLDITATSGSVNAVVTSGAQTYDAAMTVNGDLTGGSIAFLRNVNFPGGAIVESDTIDFLGATGSVTGGGELTLIPLTDGVDVDLGGGSGTLNLNADALQGYDAGLVIGGIVTSDNIITRADHVVVDGDFSVGENGYLTIVSRSGISLLEGTISGDTLTLIAADQSGSITNDAARASDSLLQANNIILVAGGNIGDAENNIDLNAVSLSGIGTLEVASGASSAVVNNIGNSLLEPRTPPRALAIAEMLNLVINTNLQITSSAQNSVSREQSAGLADEGFIDPSLFEDIALYEVSGTGIALPADQSEEEAFDEGPSMDCNTEDENCDLQGSGPMGITSPQ